MPVEILMPALSPTMTEGNLAKWTKKEGDKVSAGDVIAEIETDKATMEVEAVDEGTLGKILVAEGTEGVPVNKVIALLLEEGEDKKALNSYKVKEEAPAANEDNAGAGDSTSPAQGGQNPEKDSGGGQMAAPAAIAPKATTAPKPQAGATVVNNDRSIKASPLARRRASELGVNLANVKGTGPKGRIVEADVDDAALRGGSGGAVSRDAVEFDHLPNSSMRKTVAKRLTESKQQVPHFYLTVDCRLDALLDVRAQINDKAVKAAGIGADGKPGKPAYKVSVNDMVIKAVALALRDVPDANVSYYDDAIVRYRNVDVSVAVALEGGLITPIVQNADQKSMPQISLEMKDLAARARAGKLMPEEYTGGGFSISNLGMYGIKHFGAIVNPPQGCILAVGAGEQRAVVKAGQLTSATVMDCTLSVDHRAVDGALGAQFLAAFKGYIENPVTMLI